MTSTGHFREESQESHGPWFLEAEALFLSNKDSGGGWLLLFPAVLSVLPFILIVVTSLCLMADSAPSNRTTFKSRKQAPAGFRILSSLTGCSY